MQKTPALKNMHPGPSAPLTDYPDRHLTPWVLPRPSYGQIIAPHVRKTARPDTLHLHLHSFSLFSPPHKIKLNLTCFTAITIFCVSAQ